ncbi:hypothetical protein B296_00010607 [Ensete ventricosum]|uniref:Uncharacterized protein n=1 Tax=Ensete ventricosum TaxID=4639 RepID=A0A426ZXF1_ENSVE|nr:hypothetical protein B296_00010607 [Ensete ventricosum]
MFPKEQLVGCVVYPCDDWREKHRGPRDPQRFSAVASWVSRTVDSVWILSRPHVKLETSNSRIKPSIHKGPT